MPHVNPVTYFSSWQTQESPERRNLSLAHWGAHACPHKSRGEPCHAFLLNFPQMPEAKWGSFQWEDPGGF